MKKRMKKRILSTIIVLSMVTSIFLSLNNIVFASSTNDKLLTCNSTQSSAHFIDENTYIDKNDELVTLSTQPSSDWFNQYFGQICDFKWISNPRDPISVEDFLLLLYYMQMSAEPDKSYPRRDIDFEDLDDYLYEINMIQILSSTGTWTAPSILSGTETETGLRLDLHKNITRAQAAKIIDTACNDWYKAEKVRNPINFVDISNSWAKDFIKNVYEYGFINGIDNSHFEPDSNLSVEQAIMMLYNIMETTDKYTINDFVSSINNNDVSKITQVFSQDYTSALGTKLSNIMFFFNKFEANDLIFYTSKAFPSENTINYKEKTLYCFFEPSSGLRLIPNIYTYLCEVTAPITIIPPDEFGIELDKDGYIKFWNEAKPGKYEFKIINEFGNEDILTLYFYSKPTDLPLKRDVPNLKLWCKEGNEFFLNVGDTIDLSDFLINVHGDIHIFCKEAKYVEFDGKSKITVIKAPSPNIDYMEKIDTVYVSDDYTTIPLFLHCQ